MTDEITQEDAQRAATQHQQLTSLASALAPPKTGCSACLVKGVVTAVAYPYITVQVDGDTLTSIANVRYLEAYSPVVGDTCTMLKQGPDLLAIGRINTTTGAAALNGWTQPTLNTGFTHSADPIMWRVVSDHGDNLLQIRGSCTASGVTYSSNLATLFTLPAGSRPASNRSILIPRDAGGLCVKVNFISSTGVVQIDNLVGVRSGIEGGGAATSSSSHGSLAGTTVDLQHYHNTNGVDSTGVIYNGVGGAMYGGNPHYHITNAATHSHLGGDHQHNLALNVPSSLWLTGVSLILA